MAITLADAQVNVQDDVDFAIIDEFRKSAWVADNFVFDDAVNPGGGGATLTYGYTRLTTERAAEFRDINTEATDGEAKRQRFTVDLLPITGSYKLDRVIAKLGPAASNEIALQSQQAIKAVRAKFNDAVINGGTSADGSFDGLDAALAGSSTELVPDAAGTAYADWSALTTDAGYHDAMDLLDEFLGLMDGAPTAIFANGKAIARIRSLARRAGYYERTKDDFGRVVETYNGVPFVDLGAKDGSSTAVIPVETRDPDAGGAGGNITNLTDIYAARVALDGLHGVATVGSQLLQTWLPDFSTAGAVKRGEVEMGPVSVALKATKAAAVLRNVKLS